MIASHPDYSLVRAFQREFSRARRGAGQSAVPPAGSISYDDLRADVYDTTPWDDGVIVCFGLSRPRAATRADAIALKNAELAGDDAGHAESPLQEFAAEVVDMAEPLS